jgi:hypothetical protein
VKTCPLCHKAHEPHCEELLADFEERVKRDGCDWAGVAADADRIFWERFFAEYGF